MTTLNAASIHGRFQPFHNGHLEYALAAKEKCDFLWVGITKYDITPSEFTPLGRARELPENNPLTYFERISIISESLADAGIGLGEFGFVPFPIETPHRLSGFMPTSIPCFTTICEDWNREKVRILRGYGYKVTVLWERAQKLVTGGTIRNDIINGGSDWLSMVPPATVRASAALNLRQRLMQLRSLVAGDADFEKS